MSGANCTINPIKTKDYLTAAKRPPHVLMNKEKISKNFGLKINFWKDSLKICMTNLEISRSLNNE